MADPIKVSALPIENNPAENDLVMLVTDETSAYISKAVTVGELATLINALAPEPEVTATINVILGHGLAVITTGVKGFLEVPYDCEIEQVTLLADQSGSIVVDIWRDPYANYPPTVADTITAAAKPTLSSAQKAQDTTLSGWSKTLKAGDILAFNVDSATTVTRVTLSLLVRKT